MSYIGNQPVLNTSEFREEFAVTSTQTVFNTGGFTASSDSATLEVLRNGVLLGTADYTLGSDASTVTLGNAAVSGDIIVIKGRRELTNGVQVTERRHEHTIASGETTVTFPYPLTVSQTDVYLNGVKLGASDFSINSSTRVVSFTINPAVGDLVAIVSREPALTANSSLPVVDAAGNNVLSEANNIVSIDSGVKFPAGHPIQHLFFTTTHNGQNTNATYYYYGGNTGGTGATGTPLGQITLKQPNAKLLVVWTGVLSTGSHVTNGENAISTFIRYSTNNDLSSSTEKQLYQNYSDMRAGGDLPQQTLMTKTGRVSFTLSNSANDVYYFGIKDTKYGWSAGWVPYGEGNLLEIIEIQQ